MKKRALSLLLAGVMTAALLAGCGGSDAPSDEASDLQASPKGDGDTSEEEKPQGDAGQDGQAGGELGGSLVIW